GVVADDDARHGLEQPPRPVRRQRVTGLDVDGFRVACEDRDPHGRARNPELWQMEDLAALVDALPLFLRVAVIEAPAYLRQGAASWSSSGWRRCLRARPDHLG